MEPNSTLCATAEYLSNSGTLRAMLILRCIVDTCALTFFIVLFKIQSINHLALHVNARILLISHHIWAILQSLTTLLAYAYDLIRLSKSYDNPCDYLLSTRLGIVLRGPVVFTLYGEVWAIAAMAIERCVATVIFRTYDASKRVVWGYGLVIIQWLLTFLWFFIAIVDLDWIELKAYPAVSTGKTSQIMSNLLFVLAGVELTTLCAFYFLLWINKLQKFKIRNAALTIKYQVEENIRSIHLMTPMVWTHFCCFMPSLIALPIYMRINPDLNPLDFTIFLEGTYAVPLYSLLLPVILFLCHKILRTNFRKVIGMNQILPLSPRVDGRTHEQVRHFQILNQIWAAKQDVEHENTVERAVVFSHGSITLS